VTPMPSPTPSETPAVAPPAPEETTPPPPVEALPEPPGAVTIVYVGEGGGSGEVMVTWAPIAGATGYRVYRSGTPDGPFVRSARFDVASGESTVEFDGTYEYIQIWQPLSGDYLDIQYVEAVAGGPGYFRVTAFNAGGEGPASGTVCGVPPYAAFTC